MNLAQCPMCMKSGCLHGEKGLMKESSHMMTMLVESWVIVCEYCGIMFLVPSDLYNDKEIELMFTLCKPPEGKEWKDSQMN